MVHEVVDIARWTAMFPLARLREEARQFVLDRRARQPDQYPSEEAVARHIALMEPSGESITGPYHIAVVEQIREEAQDGLVLRNGLMTDVFVWCKGEPARREVTKIGGLPYWPAERPWPVSRSGAPLIFIAQICFTDSVDLVGVLPGDILLVFGDPSHEWDWDVDADGLTFEWMTCGDRRLVSAEAVPQAELPLWPCYGAIHRTRDYPKPSRGFSSYNGNYRLGIIEGTKIGGLPRWIQAKAVLPGRFLCALGSIGPKPQQLYPFINMAEPLDWFDNNYLMWGDAGSLYIFIEESGRIHSTLQSY